MKQALADIKAIVEEEKRKAFNDGLNAGIRVAETLQGNYGKNHHLLHPLDICTLNDWANREIQILKDTRICKE